MLLPGLIQPVRPMWAVFAGDNGEVVIEPVVAIGVYQLPPKNDAETVEPKRLAVSFTQGQFIEIAEFKPNFVSLTGSAPDAFEWADRCKAKRDEINEKERNQKIIVPGEKQIVGAFN